jgi:hypothetical protein
MDIAFAILVGALGVAVALFLAFRSHKDDDQGKDNKKNKQQPKKLVPRGPRKKTVIQGPNIRSADSVEVEDEERTMLQFLRGTQEQLAKERKEENKKKAKAEKKILEQNPSDDNSETSDDDEEAEYIIITKRKKAEKNEKKDGEKKGKKGDKKKKGFFKPGVFKQLKADQQREKDEQEAEEATKGKKGKKKAEGEKSEEAAAPEKEKKPKQPKEGGEQKPKKSKAPKEGEEASENKENVPEGNEGEKPKRGAFRGGRGGGRGGSTAPRESIPRKPREYVAPPSGPYEPASLDDMLKAISSFYGTSATPKKSFFTDIPRTALFKILRSLPLKDLLKLTLVNHFLLKTINKDDKLWKSLCERDLKLKFNDKKDQKKRFKQVYVEEYKKAKQPKQPKAEVVA